MEAMLDTIRKQNKTCKDENVIKSRLRLERSGFKSPSAMIWLIIQSLLFNIAYGPLIVKTNFLLFTATGAK